MDYTEDTSRSIVSTVVEKVAEREDVEPMELQPPLYSIIDPDALNEVFAPTKGGLSRESGYIEFDYCGHEVVVHGDGHVSIGDDDGIARNTPEQ